MPEPGKKYYRSRKNRLVAGVCGGLGEYFNVDPVFVRAIFVGLFFVNLLGLFAYIILAILAPLESKRAE